MSEQKKIHDMPDAVNCLTDVRCFYKAYLIFTTNSESYREAFEKTERYIEEHTNKRRYAVGGYDSFRVAKCRLQKQKRNKHV